MRLPFEKTLSISLLLDLNEAIFWINETPKHLIKTMTLLVSYRCLNTAVQLDVMDTMPM